MRLVVAIGALGLLGGCGIPPPPSQVPTAAAAIGRMRATLAPCGAVGAGATFEVSRSYALLFKGAVRGDLFVYAATPGRIRLGVFNDFGVNLLTLTSDGARFALADVREGRFYVGPASACNMARFTTVPMPPTVLVELLLGRAPVLTHAPGAGTIEWSGDGHYVVSIPGTRDATQEIHMAPPPADLRKPWSEQRMRVVGVKVRQYGHTLYSATLDGYRSAPMGKERVDEDGIDPPISPSGPLCEAELPRHLKIAVPDQNQEIDFRYKDTDLMWNPPLPEGTFEQPVPGGLSVVPVRCD